LKSFTFSFFSNILECCKCGRMRFNCANGLEVLCAAYREDWMSQQKKLMSIIFKSRRRSASLPTSLQYFVFCIRFLPKHNKAYTTHWGEPSRIWCTLLSRIVFSTGYDETTSVAASSTTVQSIDCPTNPRDQHFKPGVKQQYFICWMNL